MSSDEITLRDVYDLGPIEYSAERFDPAKVVELGLEIARQVGAKVTLANLPGVTQSVLDCVAETLKIRLSEICVEAWNKREDIRRLDSEAESKNSKPRIITLAKHSVDWKYKPTVTLSANGAPLATLEFTAAMTLTLDAVTLTVQNGRLLRIATGTGTIGGSLHCQKLELVAKKTAPHRLPGTIEFSGGLPLGASRKPAAGTFSAAH